MTTINEAEDLINRAINGLIDASPSVRMVRNVLNLALEGIKVPTLLSVDCSVMDAITDVRRQHARSSAVQARFPGALVSLSDAREASKSVRIHICVEPNAVPARVSTDINLNDVAIFVVHCIEGMLTVSLFQINMGNQKPVFSPIIAHIWSDNFGWAIDTKGGRKGDDVSTLLFDASRLIEGLHIFHALRQWSVSDINIQPPTFDEDRVAVALDFIIKNGDRYGSNDLN